jgi:predicted DNA-binding transcriptional regulator
MKAKVETWLEQLRTGAIKSNLVRVLAHIKSKDFGTTIYEMRKELGMSHQSLTATISMLADEGLLMDTGVIQRETSWYTIYIFVEHPNVRRELAEKRHREKFIQWVERGLKEYESLMYSDTKRALAMERDYTPNR